MRYPEFLKEKGTIGFAAPSFGCATEPYRSTFENAQKKFKKLGYSCELGPNCYAAEGIGISNTPEKCGEEINQMFAAASNDVIISCGGGEMMCEILDYVDFEQIGKNVPKWYMGYSDNTNLTFLLPTLCDTAAIYGPCAGAFGMEPWHPAIQDAHDLIAGKKLTMKSYKKWEKTGLKSEKNPLVPYNVTKKVRIRAFGFPAQEDKIEVSGRLLGGCMDCLVNLLGTKYDKVKEFDEKYAEDGIIWFMEACDLNVFGIRRAIWQMQHAGWFGHVKAFLIGRPLCNGQELMGLDQYHAVYDLLEEYHVPVIMDVDLGHLPPMMPLISGSMATVSCKRRKKDKENYRLKIKMELR